VASLWLSAVNTLLFAAVKVKKSANGGRIREVPKKWPFAVVGWPF